MLTNNNLFLLKLALEATFYAGKKIVEKLDDIKILNSIGKDIKTDIDKESNYIINKILDNSNIKILSEEQDFNGQLDNTKIWVVDPIDGTYNLFRGLTNFVCTSICLVVDSKPVIAVLGRCFCNEVLVSFENNFFKLSYEDIENLKLENLHSFLISKKQNLLDQAKITDINQACLFSGFPVGSSNIFQNIQDLSILAKSVKKVRMIGSAATSLFFVTTNVADIYFERDIFYWDVIAGLALVKSSGGDYFIKINPDFKCVVIATSTNQLLKQAIKILQVE